MVINYAVQNLKESRHGASGVRSGPILRFTSDSPDKNHFRKNDFPMVSDIDPIGVIGSDAPMGHALDFSRGSPEILLLVFPIVYFQQHIFFRSTTN
jgi:hypothetical protein